MLRIYFLPGHAYSCYFTDSVRSQVGQELHFTKTVPYRLCKIAKPIFIYFLFSKSC